MFDTQHIHTLPNGVQITNEREHRLAALFDFRCTVHRDRWMITIHHEPPRSKNPDYAEMPETWFPVCQQCHDTLHTMSRLEADMFLKFSRDKNYPNVKERLQHV